MIEVEQRPLRAFAEHALAAVERLVDEQRDVGDEGRETLGVAHRRGLDRFGIEPADAVQEAELLVLELQRRRDLLAQDLAVEQVLHADADAGGLVGVGGPDAASRGTDLQGAEVHLGRLIEHAVPRHDEVGTARDAQARSRAAARLELVEFLAQHLGVEHDAVAEHATHAGEEDATRQQPELERLLAHLHGVAGVVAALVTRDDGERLGQQVDDLALALVAPLGADDDGGGRCGRAHCGRVAAGSPAQGPGLRISSTHAPRRSRPRTGCSATGNAG